MGPTGALRSLGGSESSTTHVAELLAIGEVEEVLVVVDEGGVTVEEEAPRGIEVSGLEGGVGGGLEVFEAFCLEGGRGGGEAGLAFFALFHRISMATRSRFNDPIMLLKAVPAQAVSFLFGEKACA
jgi:hypothetical protein